MEDCALCQSFEENFYPFYPKNLHPAKQSMNVRVEYFHKIELLNYVPCEEYALLKQGSKPRERCISQKIGIPIQEKGMEGGRTKNNGEGESPSNNCLSGLEKNWLGIGGELKTSDEIL